MNLIVFSGLQFFIHWPGDPLRLPLDLLDQVKLVSIKDGVSPDYGDPILLANIGKHFL
jgi:hypothetical protein